MDPPVKLLPLELEEEILSRLPLSSLARFKTVCKKWKALFSDQSFLSRVRPQIICLTNSHQVYSIDIIDLHSTEPKILKRKIPSSNHIPDSDVFHTNITTCDEFLFCNSRFKNKRTAIWNLVMRQPKWIEYEVGVEAQFYVCGLGYDNTGPKKVYKMLGYFLPYYRVAKKQLRVYVYECASHALKYIYIPDDDLPFKEEETRTNVSLNGNLYWVTHNPTNYFIRSFDFSMEVFKTFCLLPFQKNHFRDELVLAVFKGDRFSLLNLSYLERKINIWVTKKKINDREQVVWINLMTWSPTDLPKIPRPYVCTGMSYYIYDNTLVMCCSSDETGQACIYIVKGDMCKKITMSSMYFQCCHCAYVPNVAFLPSKFI